MDCFTSLSGYFYYYYYLGVSIYLLHVPMGACLFLVTVKVFLNFQFYTILRRLLKKNLKIIVDGEKDIVG